MKSRLPRFLASFVSLGLIFSLNANLVAAFDPVDDLREKFVQEAAKKKPLPPVRYIPSREYDLRHVALDLKFDWNAEQAYGTATLTFAPLLANTKTATFHAALASVGSVKLADGKALQYKLDSEKETLVVDLDRAYQPNQIVTIAIDYRSGKPRGGSPIGGAALTFIKPNDRDPNRPRQIWSQGQPENNRFWFPSFDHPSDFRTSELRATIEKPFMVISNGKLISTTENKDNTRTYHWKMDVPYTNYLTSIIVGEYGTVDGKYQDIPVLSYVYPNELAAGKASTGRLPQMIAAFSEITGMKYPYNKYVQTMVKDFGGAMENITATTMTDTIIQDERALLTGDTEDIQAHEAAHQWFGNYVTCRDWSDLWLNESWATFMEVVWEEKSDGRDEALLQNKEHQDAYFGTWRQGTRRPVVTKNYSDPDAVFDTYAYPRGGATLFMLRSQLGEENFWRAVNYYLRKHANQPVTTDDFRAAIEESTGQSMDVFFDQWIYKMGHPIFEITKSYDAASKTLKLNVKQTQKRDETSDYPQVELFQPPVDIEIGTASGTRVERVNLAAQPEQTVMISVDAEPLLVNWDYQNALIDEVKFDKSIDELAYQLKNDPDVMGRMWALSELRGKMNAANAADADKQKALAAFHAAVVSDKVWQVRRDAINALAPPAPQGAAAIFASITGNIAKPNFSPETVSVLLAATKDQRANVRQAAISQLGRLRDAKYADTFASALNDRSYSVIEAAANALGATKTPAAYDQISKLLEQNSWRNRIRIAGLNGLAATGDKRAMEIGFRHTDKSFAPNVRTAALGVLAETGKGDQRVFPLVFENFKKSLDTNDFNGIFSGFVSFIKLDDPRGQQAFDLAKEKFKTQQGLMNFVSQLEGAFKQATGGANKTPAANPQ
ncbi:MAG: M1 family metallopeptidase [Acidobacteriota bacterium]|nr:M1 family metallopeptidase [Acidobacteriota bacterium]